MSGFGWQEFALVFGIFLVPLWACPVFVVAWASRERSGKVSLGWVGAAILSAYLAWLVVLAWFLTRRASPRVEL